MLLPEICDHEQGLYFDAQPEGYLDTVQMIHDLREEAASCRDDYDPQDYTKKRREAILARAAAIEEYMEIRLGWRKPAEPLQDFLVGDM